MEAASDYKEMKDLMRAIHFAALNDIKITTKKNELPTCDPLFPLFYDPNSALNLTLQTLLGMRKQLAIQITFGKQNEEATESAIEMFKYYNESIKQLTGI